MDGQLALAEMIRLFTGFDETSAIFGADLDPVLHDGQRPGVEFLQSLDRFVGADDFKIDAAHRRAGLRTHP